MPDQWTRRAVVAVGLALLLAGCAGGATTGADTTTTPTETTTDTPTMTPEDSGPTIDDLPEPSPLANTLVDLVAAEDRATFAADHDIPFEDGLVHVQLELVDGGAVPRDLVSEVTMEQSGTVNVRVAPDGLVELALHEDVRIVRRIPTSKTH